MRAISFRQQRRDGTKEPSAFSFCYICARSLVAHSARPPSITNHRINEKCCREISSRAQPTRRSVQLSASANKIKARVISIPILSPRPLCKIRVCKLKSLAAAGSDLFHSDGCRVFYITYKYTSNAPFPREAISLRVETKASHASIPHIRIKYITALSLREKINI